MDVVESPHYRRFEVAVPVENQYVIIGKFAHCLRIVGCSQELAPILKRPAERQHELAYFTKRQIVVRFIPETEDGTIGSIGSNNEGADEKAFLHRRATRTPDLIWPGPFGIGPLDFGYPSRQGDFGFP